MSTISSVKPGEETKDYDTRFNILLRRFEAVAGQVNPLIKAHVFLRKASLSAGKQSQIVSAAMSRHEYEPLRRRHAYGDSSGWRLASECVPLHREQSGAYSAQVIKAQDEGDEEEHLLEANEASDDGLEAEY